VSERTPTAAAASFERFYAAVAKAQALGYFRGHHGPLEETAWVHVAVHNLEAAETAADEAIKGDVRQLSRLRSILENAPPLTFPPPANDHHDAQAARKPPLLDLHHAPLVPAAALLIDRLKDVPDSYWTRRAMGYYAVRALAVSAVLEAAQQALAGQLPYESFAAQVREKNFMTGNMAHGGGHAPTPPGRPAQPARPVPGTPPASAAELMLDAAHAGASGGELEHVFRPVLEIATLGSTVTSSAVLETLAASHHFDEDRCGCFETLAATWSTVGPTWKTFLFPPLAGAGQPPTINQPVPIPPPPALPAANVGGRWEIAQLTVSETAELCPPAQAVKNVSNQIYGQAGAQLIKAQNEITKAQQCVEGAGTKKCAQYADHGYSKCTEERDDGYDRCAKEEDHGHHECCDWWPCSWACDALVWIVNIVCVLFEWISHIVCVAWTWIKKMVCVSWEVLKAALCAAGHIAKAAVHAGAGIGGVAVGAGIGATGKLLDAICKATGVKPASRTTDSLKVVGVHLAVLHTNKVLLFSYDEGVYPVSASKPADFTSVGDSDRGLSALWDPATNTAKYVPLSRNLFCAHQSFTEFGHLFVAGGQFPLPGLLKSLIPPKLLAPGADKDIHTFDPIKETWTRHSDMEKGRWYPTCVTLLDGRIFIASGTNGYATEAGLGRGIQDTWQIADPATGVVGMSVPFGHHLFHLYPFQHVLPGGKVFVHFKRTTVLYDPSNGSFQRVAASGKGPTQTGETRHPYSRTGPGPGTCCLLPLIPTYNPSTGQVSYPAGRVLILGGGGAEKEPEPADPTDEEPRSDGTTGYKLHSDVLATSTAEILDFSSPSPEWALTTAMWHGRVMPDSVVLPNAKVLVVGGGRFGQSGGLLAHFTSTDTSGNPDKGATDPVLEPEMYDPVAATWTRLTRKPLARLYHTTAVLLADARVLVAGHDGALNMPPYDTSRYELEIFSPPYLFGADGNPAPRPVITDAPAELPFGRTFAIKTANPSSIAGVALIRQSSTTHQINSDQRYVGLAIVDRTREAVMVQPPVAGDVAPPGYYMLFIVNDAGVPSVARWMRVAAQRP
jgi:hypothetical protein